MDSSYRLYRKYQENRYRYKVEQIMDKQREKELLRIVLIEDILIKIVRETMGRRLYRERAMGNGFMIWSV